MKLQAAVVMVVVLLIGVALGAGGGVRLPQPAPAPPVVLAAAGDPSATVTVTVSSSETLTFPARSIATSMRQTATWTGGGGGAGKSELGGFTVVKAFDASTIRLQHLLLTGKTAPKVLVKLSTGGRYTLTDVIVSEIKSAGAKGNTPTDRVTLTSRQFRSAYGGVVSCWDSAALASC